MGADLYWWLKTGESVVLLFAVCCSGDVERCGLVGCIDFVCG